MKNQPNKATVKDGFPTAERILNDHVWMGTEPTEAQSAILAAMQEYSDQQNAELRNQLADLERENSEYRAVYDSVVKNRDELSGQLQSETESRKHWQRQAQRYQKYHKELNSALERVKELEEICEYALKAIKAVNSPFGATKPIIKRIEKALKK